MNFPVVRASFVHLSIYLRHEYARVARPFLADRFTGSGSHHRVMTVYLGQGSVGARCRDIAFWQ